MISMNNVQNNETFGTWNRIERHCRNVKLHLKFGPQVQAQDPDPGTCGIQLPKLGENLHQKPNHGSHLLQPTRCFGHLGLQWWGQALENWPGFAQKWYTNLEIFFPISPKLFLFKVFTRLSPWPLICNLEITEFLNFFTIFDSSGPVRTLKISFPTHN